MKHEAAVRTQYGSINVPRQVVGAFCRLMMAVDLNSEGAVLCQLVIAASFLGHSKSTRQIDEGEVIHLNKVVALGENTIISRK